MPRLIGNTVVLLFLGLHLPSDCAVGISLAENAELSGIADTGEANGAAFGDYDSDGLPDLLVTRLGEEEPALLYRNEGNAVFSDASSLWDGPHGALGAVFADLDRDGHLDIFAVVHNAANELHRQQDGRFFAVDPPDGMLQPPSAMSAAFADFDGDGRLDQFNTYRAVVPNQLFFRTWDRGFSDETLFQSPLRGGRESSSATTFDFDGDGSLDLYVSNFGWPDMLHLNDGQGRFRQVSHSFDLPVRSPTIGALPADFDHDGDTDLYLLSGAGESNRMYENAAPDLVDVTAATGVGGGDHSSLGGAWSDFDNDGYLDLLVSNVGVPVSIYRNDRSGRFDEVGEFALSAADLEKTRTAAGVAASDIDLDGDVDVFLCGILGADALLLNRTPGSGGWIDVRLRAREGFSPLGARVTLTAAGGTQTRTFAATTLLGTQQGNLLHFGLGGDSVADQISIAWPSGQRQILDRVAANGLLEVDEPVPRHDLSVSLLTGPRTGTWRPRHLVARIVNRGSRRSDPRKLEARIGLDGDIEYGRDLAVAALDPGDTLDLGLPAWTPARSGEHRVELALTGEDEVAGNDSRHSSEYLHLFREVAASLGVAEPGNGWAAAFADYDNDGDVDLYVSNGGSIGSGANRLYRNEGGRGFSEVTEAARVADDGNGTGVVFGDFDRDGFQDLFIAKGGFNRLGEQNRLFRNTGDGSFGDISLQAGLDVVSGSFGAAAGDYDRDGYLDLFVPAAAGQVNRLYRNHGRGGFEDVTRLRGIFSSRAWSGAGAAFADYDNDGDVDLYAGVFGGADIFYLETGEPEYTAISLGNGGETVGMAMGDYDGDADIDVYAVNLNARSVLYRNDLTALEDIGSESGTENFGVGTGAAFGDFDSDGDLDLFVTNAHVANRVYVNQDGRTFRDEAPALDMADTLRSRAVLLADCDNDGDQDVYVVNEGGPNRLYENGGSQHRWIKLALRGTESNTDGIGARVSVYSSGRVLVREVNGTSGLAQGSRVQHVGMGSGRLDSVRVLWPSGRLDSFRDLEENGTTRLVEGETITAVEEQMVPGLPFVLAPNYPNPFNQTTVIPFSGGAGRMRLIVYNSLGQRIRDLFETTAAQAGSFRVRWDGLTDAGAPAASGVYFARLTFDPADGRGARHQTHPLLLLR